MSKKTSKLGWAALGAALSSPLVYGLSLVIVAASHRKRPSAAYDTIMTISSVMFAGAIALQLVAIVAGTVAMFEKDTQRVVPGIAIGCGVVPLVLMVLIVALVAITGGV